MQYQIYQPLLDIQKRIFEIFYSIEKSEYDPDEDVEYAIADLEDRASCLYDLLKEFKVTFKQCYLIADNVEFNNLCTKSFNEFHDLKNRFYKYIEFIYKHPESIIDDEELAALAEYNDINTKFLKEILSFIKPYLANKEQQNQTELSIAPLPFTDQKIKQKYTLTQAALIKTYLDESIDKKNRDAVAISFGHKSGDRLYQLFNIYRRPLEIYGDAGTSKKNTNKIKNLEAIIDYFPDRIDIKDKIRDHIGLLNKHL